jgi:hypothetical protein
MNDKYGMYAALQGAVSKKNIYPQESGFSGDKSKRNPRMIMLQAC